MLHEEDNHEYDTDPDSDSMDVISYDVDEPHPYKNVLVLCTQYRRTLYADAMAELPEEVDNGFITVFRLREILQPSELPGMFELFSEEEEEELEQAAANMRLEIAQVYLVDDMYSMCLLKTWWLKVVQRTWKRVYRERMALLSSPAYLLHGQTHGHGNKRNKFWIPRLQGMLSGIKGGKLSTTTARGTTS